MKKLLLLLVLLTASPVSAVETLRLALLPIPDTLPVYVAEESGFFAQEGVKIKVMPVGSAVMRDQLMQAGQVDGILNELATTAALNREKPTAKVVAVARTPQKNSPLFRILAGPKTTIKSATGLAGVPVAVSRNTVIEYISDRILQQAGIPQKKISYISVPVLPERMQLLLSGQVQAATMPDPLGFSAMQNGAVELANDLGNPLSLSVLTMTEQAVTQKRGAVAAFVRAWNRAAAAINADPEKWRQTLVKNVRMPKNVVKTYPIPPFPVATLPTAEQWDDTMQWMVKKGLLPAALPYKGSVTAAFQPEPEPQPAQ